MLIPSRRKGGRGRGVSGQLLSHHPAHKEKGDGREEEKKVIAFCTTPKLRA